MLDQSEFAIAMKSFSSIVLEHRKQSNDYDSVNEAQSKWNICVCKLCGYMWKARKNITSPKKCPSCGSTLWNKEDAKTIHCYRCNHTWNTRKERPTHCPKCGSRTYDKEMIEVRCMCCGSQWSDKMPLSNTGFSCPQCGEISRRQLMILPDSTSIISDTPSPEQKHTTAIPKDIIEKISKEPENTLKLQSLIKSGLTPTEAKILIDFINGENVLSIASAFNLSVKEVMNIIVPYIETVEAEGS